MLGRYAQDQSYKKVITIVPNYQAGRDAVAGFKRDFKGEVADELYVPLGQLDYSGGARPHCRGQAGRGVRLHPGGMGVAFVKQFRQAGLTMPVLSAFTVDESTLPAQGDAALGMLAGSNWGAQIWTIPPTRRSSQRSRRSTTTCPRPMPSRRSTRPC